MRTPNAVLTFSAFSNSSSHLRQIQRDGSPTFLSSVCSTLRDNFTDQWHCLLHLHHQFYQCYHSNQNIYRPTQKYWGFHLGYRTILPLPTLNSSDVWIGHFAQFTDKGLCVSAGSTALLAKSPIRMTDNKYWGFGGYRFFISLPTSNPEDILSGQNGRSVVPQGLVSEDDIPFRTMSEK